jgi:hypothetical protein
MSSNCLHTHIYIHIHVYIYTFTYMYVCKLLYERDWYLKVLAWYFCTFLRGEKKPSLKVWYCSVLFKGSCMYVYIYIYIYVYIYMWICIYICIYVCMQTPSWYRSIHEILASAIFHLHVYIYVYIHMYANP